MDRLRLTGLIGLLLALGACADDHPRTADGPASPSSTAVATEDKSASASATPTAAADAPAASAEVDIDAAHARRLADAQAYLDLARKDAEGRHRRALEACERGAPQADFDACVATAEESLQAEMRAARVEFDARMATPN